VKYFRLILAFTTLVLLGSACVEVQPITTTVTPTTPVQAVVVITPARTETIQWFPATRTPTPAPTIALQPTMDLRPGRGSTAILSDDFSQTKGWSSGQSAAGTISIGDHALTLANPGQQGMLLSLRSATNLSDYYLEITSSLSLCRGTDNYGLLLRAESAQDYYRFLISCSGQLRLERVKNGRSIFLQDWTFSGQVPPGSPLVLKLGVWALGSELRFFVNDLYQFSVRDSVLTTGSLGVFSRASGQNPLTVSFSDLQVYPIDAHAVPTPAPTITITATATRTPYGPTRSPTPVFMREPTGTPQG
jgi:hypothetical protein